MFKYGKADEVSFHGSLIRFYYPELPEKSLEQPTDFLFHKQKNNNFIKKQKVLHSSWIFCMP